MNEDFVRDVIRDVRRVAIIACVTVAIIASVACISMAVQNSVIADKYFNQQAVSTQINNTQTNNH